jgi:hypothetical protein
MSATGEWTLEPKRLEAAYHWLTRLRSVIVFSQFCAKKVHRLRQTLRLTHKDAQHTVKTQGPKGGQTQKSKRSKKKQTAVTQSAADKAKGGNVYTEKTINVAEVKNDR